MLETPVPETVTECGEPEAFEIARRLQRSFSEPIEVRGRRFSTTASVGLSVARAGDDPEVLLSQADGAMYAAKRNGRDRIETHQQA